jgi:hypothetical protein
MKLLCTLLFALVATASHALDGQPVFVEQILEPTGGKIVRPKDWHYAEAHRGQAYRWVIAKEDPSNGKPYETGVSIQTFVGVKSTTGRSAQQFIQDFASSKSRTARSLSDCPATSQGLFVRMCLETEEGAYRILYSLFWGANNMDIAVVMVAGAPKEQWGIYQPIFARMGSFELIDMSRFSK